MCVFLLSNIQKRCDALRCVDLQTHTTPTTTANNDAAALLQLFVGFVISAHLYLSAFEACSVLVHKKKS